MNRIFFKEIDSTNKYCKENLDRLNHFDVILTDKQLSGYGQWERKWTDTGVDNIYMTIVLKPNQVKEHTNIVRYTAICICKIFQKFDVIPKIKEPNDILINNKKICGILAESITKGDKTKGIIVGIGINLNTDKDTLLKIDQPATSLNIETGKNINKEAFRDFILKEFEENYTNFLEKKVNLNLFS